MQYDIHTAAFVLPRIRPIKNLLIILVSRLLFGAILFVQNNDLYLKKISVEHSYQLKITLAYVYSDWGKIIIAVFHIKFINFFLLIHTRILLSLKIL